ncbi:7 transmembrane receptor [Dictyocaulus viviparus]|uniref:7 transmembrane receptor n=1 Tax=Dictyocaulus viviparus TaxID=29172 RepID=A0A0D8XGF1_DICVI|nr:7 transmembrane receptor [Dictyocaulus viviparus]
MSNVTYADTSWNPPHGVIMQIAVWILVMILSIETIIGNAMVVLAYKIERNIGKKVSNRYIASLAMSDLIIGVEGFPLLTVYVLNGERWPLGEMACKTWLFLDYTLCLVSILTVLLITADRYLSVCHTAKYLKWQSSAKTELLIVLSWLIPAIIFGVIMYGWESITGIQSASTAECSAPFLTNPYINMGMYLTYYWTTLVAMLILYKGIHQATKSLEKKAKAKEQRNMALILSQRLGTQVGVTLMLHSRSGKEDDHPRSNSEWTYLNPEVKTTETVINTDCHRQNNNEAQNIKDLADGLLDSKTTSMPVKSTTTENESQHDRRSWRKEMKRHIAQTIRRTHVEQNKSSSELDTRKISSMSTAVAHEPVISSIFAPISGYGRRRRRTAAERRAHKAFSTIQLIMIKEQVD